MMNLFAISVIFMAVWQGGQAAVVNANHTGLSHRFADNQPYLARVQRGNTTVKIDSTTGDLITGTPQDRIISSVRLHIQVVNRTATTSNRSLESAAVQESSHDQDEEMKEGELGEPDEGNDGEGHHDADESEENSDENGAPEQIQHVSDENGQLVNVSLSREREELAGGRSTRYPSSGKKRTKIPTTTEPSSEDEDEDEDDTDRSEAEEDDEAVTEENGADCDTICRENLDETAEPEKGKDGKNKQKVKLEFSEEDAEDDDNSKADKSSGKIIPNETEREDEESDTDTDDESTDKTPDGDDDDEEGTESDGKPPVCFGDWTTWTNCKPINQTHSVRERARFKLLSEADPDPEMNLQTEDCEHSSELSATPGLMSEWSVWSECSKTCDSGIQTRFRAKIGPTRRGHLAEPTSDVRPCGQKKCIRIIETPTFLGDWSAWSACTRSCGGGIQSRFRKCLLVSSAQYVSFPDLPVRDSVAIPKPRPIPRQRCIPDGPNTAGTEVMACAVSFCPGDLGLLDQRYAQEFLYKTTTSRPQVYTSPLPATTESAVYSNRSSSRLVPSDSDEFFDSDHDEIYVPRDRPASYPSSTGSQQPGQLLPPVQPHPPINFPIPWNLTKVGPVVQMPIQYDVAPLPERVAGPPPPPKVLCVALNGTGRVIPPVPQDLVNALQPMVAPPPAIPASVPNLYAAPLPRSEKLAVQPVPTSYSAQPAPPVVTAPLPSNPIMPPTAMKVPVTYPSAPSAPLVSVPYLGQTRLQPSSPNSQAGPPMLYEVAPRYLPYATVAPLNPILARRYQEENQVDYADYDEHH